MLWFFFFMFLVFFVDVLCCFFNVDFCFLKNAKFSVMSIYISTIPTLYLENSTVI